MFIGCGGKEDVRKGKFVHSFIGLVPSLKSVILYTSWETDEFADWNGQKAAVTDISSIVACIKDHEGWVRISKIFYWPSFIFKKHYIML